MIEFWLKGKIRDFYTFFIAISLKICSVFKPFPCRLRPPFQQRKRIKWTLHYYHLCGLLWRKCEVCLWWISSRKVTSGSMVGFESVPFCHCSDPIRECILFLFGVWPLVDHYTPYFIISSKNGFQSLFNVPQFSQYGQKFYLFYLFCYITRESSLGFVLT